MDEEIWKPIEYFENLYEVSNQGRVKSLERTIVRSNGRVLHLKERILKPASGIYGRNQYTLSKDGVKFDVRGYVLVAKAFLPNPNHLPEINHIDGNNKNDCVSNLEWCSTEDNLKHALQNNLFNTYHKRKNKLNFS